MLASTLFRRLALVVPLLSGAYLASQAQDTGTGELLVYRVHGLTSSDRDALVQGLSEDAGLKVVFACVPAGLIAFEAANEGLRTQVEALLGPQGEDGRAERLPMDLRALEEACSQQRGQ